MARACGIDVSGKAAGQQLVVLDGEPGGPLAATFHEPGTVEAVAATVAALGEDVAVGVDAPAAGRLDLLGPGAPGRAALELRDGRYERMRVCDAQLFRRGLPLYPVPPVGEAPTGWQAWMAVGYELFGALAARGIARYAPLAADGALEGPVGRDALAHGRACEAFPDGIFCALLGRRPAPKRAPSGARDRVEALRARGIVDPGGDLWERTLDELDACAAALAAHGLAAGTAHWLGDPREGVVVMPGERLLDRYPRRVVPARVPLRGDYTG